MRCTVLCSTASHFFTIRMATLLASSMFYTEFCGRLSGFITAIYRTSTTTSMSRAQAGTTHRGFIASIRFATLSTTVGRAKEFISSPLVASRVCTPASSSMSDAKSSGTLGTFVAAIVFTHSIAAMADTVWSACGAHLTTSLYATWLSTCCHIGKPGRDLIRGYAILTSLSHHGQPTRYCLRACWKCDTSCTQLVRRNGRYWGWDRECFSRRWRRIRCRSLIVLWCSLLDLTVMASLKIDYLARLRLRLLLNVSTLIWLWLNIHILIWFGLGVSMLGRLCLHIVILRRMLLGVSILSRGL
mmetsp:Transcript_117323/g.175202  ORF Transcript_117323/g.175202 Transcript_117323/m.175202 type:complete len:300 (+) Transcript_117323:250-1149(+)